MSMFDIIKKKQSLKQEKTSDKVINNSESANQNDNTETQQNNANPLIAVTAFAGFSFWVESAHTIKRIFRLMQPAVNTLKSNGYTVKAVTADGGVREFDTGYIPFSGALYTSFEEAEKNLPVAFSEEKEKQAGSLLSEVNFDYFSIIFTKDNKDFTLVFSRGELEASAEIAELIPVSEMKAVNNQVETIKE